MGQATASGENRAIEAVKGALDSPLLNDNNIKGAKQVLLKIVTGGGEEEIRMMELSDIKQKIQEAAGCEVNIIEGIGIDPELNGEVCVTVIATGFNVKVIKDDVIVTLDGEKNIDDVLSQEKEEVQEVISAKTEDKGQHTIFDNETELEMEETLNDPELEIEAIEKEVEIEIEEQELEQTEEKELSAEIDLDLEPQTVVIDLDDEVELPGELIPTLKQEDAIEEVELEIKEEAINDEETPPVNLETLTNKSREREDRLKNISMKLRTPSGLTALEDEPAYKRDNVELEETPHSSESEVSKYTLSEGEDNETEIKPNNSFLHDNVD
jgi:cell division protein FtsZ